MRKTFCLLGQEKVQNSQKMSRWYFHIWLLFVVILSVNNIHAQNNIYTLTGTIIDSHSSIPLFYVNTGLLNEADSAVVNVALTDKDGVFTFSNVKSGNYIIKTSYVGYEVYMQPISVMGENNKIKIDTILLQPSASMLQNVTISTTKPVYMNDGEKILYNVTEDPSVQTGTTADALQNAPGVEVDIEGNITLRGVSSVEIWINGRPSRLNEENLKTYIQQLPANALERIEVINNPSARYSASGTGGIINIVTKSNVLKNSFVTFGINGSTRPMVAPWFSYVYSNEKFDINVYLYGNYNFSKGKTNGYSTILNENMDTSSYRNYTGEWRDKSIWAGTYLSAAYRFDSLKTISFWGNCWSMPWAKNNSSENYIYREFINNPGIYDYRNETELFATYRIGGYFGIEYEHNFNGDGHKLVTEIWTSISNQNSNHKFQRLYKNYPELNKDKKMTFNGANYSFGGEINYSLPYHKNGVIEMGIDSWYSNEALIRRSDTLFADIYVLDSMRYEDYVGQWSNLNAYITVQHKFGGFTMKGGLRSENRFLEHHYNNQPEHHGKNIYAGLFPSLHLTYVTKSMHNFNLSYTRRVSYPRNSQLSTFIVYYEDRLATGNPDLKSIYTNSIEGGWTKYFNKFGSVGISAYFKNNKNDINELTDVIYSDFFGRYVSFTMQEWGAVVRY